MTRGLRVSLGQHSDRGRKERNQDFHGAYVPLEPQLGAKGAAMAIADGISASAVSGIASEAAVRGFLEDYFCTPEAWSVGKSAQQVLTALNGWLYAQTRQSPHRYDVDRGYVCTLTALVVKSATAHLFHVGDARAYRLRDAELEQLTQDHRLRIAPDHSYLSRALGADAQLDIDYQAFGVECGDVFILVTDGVYEHAGPECIREMLRAHGDALDAVAAALVDHALERGSNDNLTAQILRIDQLPDHADPELQRRATELPIPLPLGDGALLDGYRILRELHSSHRSHVYLASDGPAASPAVIKIPSLDLRGDDAYLERFLLEDWIARRVVSPNVVGTGGRDRRRTQLYSVTEFVDGGTLAQWMRDHPAPSLESVCGIVDQLARGLLAFHRLEMLHRDLRPENVMITVDGVVKIIDFGSVRVAGIAELRPRGGPEVPPGSIQYMAPEYFLGEPGSTRSDQYSLGVIAYQMLCGRLPYGAEVPRARSRAAQRRLRFRSVLDPQRELPAWIDPVLRKATHPDPARRYPELSEFVYDLRHAPDLPARGSQPPLLARNPLRFWQTTALVLAAAVVALLVVLWVVLHPSGPAAAP